MPSYLQIEDISKSYGPKVLFEGIGFNINEGDKMALIAPNGTGKTSLLRILAGKDKSDSGGKITFLKNIRIAFLEQDYSFDPEKGILEQIMDHSSGFLSGLGEEEVWQYELRVKQFLTNFKLPDFSKKMKELSGGEVKRVAITEMLSSEADFLIMDEPTNHLDIDAIEFLENWLSRARCTLLMVTHDRYFLDNVCNTIIELDHGKLYIYKGDYRNYLEKRSERIENYNAETDKVRNILRRELEWMRSTPQARTGESQIQDRRIPRPQGPSFKGIYGENRVPPGSQGFGKARHQNHKLQGCIIPLRRQMLSRPLHLQFPEIREDRHSGAERGRKKHVHKPDDRRLYPGDGVHR